MAPINDDVLTPIGKSPEAKSWQEQINAWATANMFQQKFALEQAFLNKCLPGSGIPPIPFGNTIQYNLQPPSQQPPVIIPQEPCKPAEQSSPWPGRLLAAVLGASTLAGGYGLSKVLENKPQTQSTKSENQSFDIGVEWLPGKPLKISEPDKKD